MPETRHSTIWRCPRSGQRHTQSHWYTFTTHWTPIREKRWRTFDALKRGDGLNINKTEESPLVGIAEEINNNIQNRNVEQVRPHSSNSLRRCTDHLFPSLSPLFGPFVLLFCPTPFFLSMHTAVILMPFAVCCPHTYLPLCH